MKKGLMLAGLLALTLALAGPAWATDQSEDPQDLDVNDFAVLFGSVYRYDLTASFFDTWIWLGLLSSDAEVHIQFYDPKCARTNDRTIFMTAHETQLLFASEVAPDSKAGVFLVEALCEDEPCALLGHLWYLNLDDGIVFTRPLYTVEGDGDDGVWDIFTTEHWDTIANGFGIFLTNLWLNCPTGKGAAGTAGNTALYDDLLVGAPGLTGHDRDRSMNGDVVEESEPPNTGVFFPGASLVDFVLYNFDESPGGSRDDVPCACLTDGPLTSFSGLFADFFGMARLRFKTSTSTPALGLAHNTQGVPGFQIFDQRFYRFNCPACTPD